MAEKGARCAAFIIYECILFIIYEVRVVIYFIIYF